jgi:hypothetical protein
LSKISSPSALSHDTKVSKVSEKDKPHDFPPKNFNHAFLPKADFEGYRNNARKEFEENQNYIADEEFHQKPEHPSTFIKMVKERIQTMSTVMMKDAKYYYQKSSGMELLTVLKYLETMLKVIMDKLVQVICLIQVSMKHI